MSGDFVDSNVVVYLVDASNPLKRGVARQLIRDAIRGDGQISFQVVQETLNVVTRKFRQTVTLADGRRLLDEILIPLWQIMPSRGLYERALQIHGRYGYRFYDSLIIASALTSGCTRLYSEDLQHGQHIEGLTIENPFAALSA